MLKSHLHVKTRYLGLSDNGFHLGHSENGDIMVINNLKWGVSVFAGFPQKNIGFLTSFFGAPGSASPRIRGSGSSNIAPLPPEIWGFPHHFPSSETCC
jgi:hypothetical protein